MNRILVCVRSSAERLHWVRKAELDRAWITPGPDWLATFSSLDLELRFVIFDRPSDVEQIRGLELAGVLGLDRVLDQQTRSHILARIRP
jgi:hypothetical protein